MGVRRGPTSWVIGLTVLAAACGGKLLTVPGPGDASSVADDAGGVAPVATSGASSSGGGQSGGSSTSGGTMLGGSASSGGTMFGGSASSGSGGTSGIQCVSSAGCPAGEVCCGMISMTTSCQRGPCPSTPIGPIQLCGTAAECTFGDTCGPIPQAPTLPVKICAPPQDAGAPSCATTCTGCCDPNGTCLMGADDTACGRRGAACVDCTTTSDVCINRACRTNSDQ